MIYSPNPKALVYSELQFISSSVPMPETKVSYDIIFDEVANEVHSLFVPKAILKHTERLLQNTPVGIEVL